MHYVAVLDDVLLALDAHLAGGADSGFSLIIDEVVVLDDLGTDEALLEIGVDDAGGAGGLVSLMDSPGAALVGAGGEEGLETEQMVCALYETDHTGLFETHLLKEHLTVVIVLHLGNLGLGPGGYDEYLGILLLDSLADGVDIFVAGDGGGVINVAYVHHRLVGEKEQVVGDRHLIIIDEGDAAAGLAGLKGGLVPDEQGGELRCLLVSGLAGLLRLGEAGVNSLKVLYLEFEVHNLLVADRIHGTVHVDDIAVVEATEDVQDGIALTDVGEELVAETFTLAGSLHQTCDIDDIDGRRDRALRFADVGQHLKALVGDIGRTEIGLDGTEREIGALRLA